MKAVVVNRYFDTGEARTVYPGEEVELDQKRLANLERKRCVKRKNPTRRKQAPAGDE